MINNKKVKVMTKLAIYEKNNESDLKISKYYKSDYIRYYVVRTILNVTFAYLCFLVLLALYNLETIIAEAVMLKYSAIGLKVLVGYIILVVMFIIISYFIYSNRYVESKKRLLNYYKQLGILNKMYKSEEKDLIK